MFSRRRPLFISSVLQFNRRVCGPTPGPGKVVFPAILRKGVDLGLREVEKELVRGFVNDLNGLIGIVLDAHHELAYIRFIRGASPVSSGTKVLPSGP